MFGAVMGLAGLGLTARAAAPLFPGVFQAPAYFTELWVALGVLAFVVLLSLYFLKLVIYFQEVKKEMTDPAQMGFRAALPVGATLVAGGLAPYAPSIANGVWWAGVVLLVVFQLWALYVIATRRTALAQVNPGWLILFVGGIVVPSSGIALGHPEVSRILFAISAVAAPLVVGLLAYRAVTQPPLPAPLRPSWFILLVPPSLIYAQGVALFREFDALDNLYYVALALLVALLVYAGNIARWPFGPAWWSFTFPLDAFAYAAARYAQSHDAPLWKGVAGLALLLATLFVAYVLLRSLARLTSAVFRPPGSPPLHS
jgi:tellurite resistance protein